MRHHLLLATLLTATAHAQWDILDTHTTADLRGVSTPTPAIVWISGANGTVLRSTDTGKTWLPCTTPPNAANLDFRAIHSTPSPPSPPVPTATGTPSPYLSP